MLIATLLAVAVLAWPMSGLGRRGTGWESEAADGDRRGVRDAHLSHGLGGWLSKVRSVPAGAMSGGLDETVELVAVGLEAGLSLPDAVEVVTELELADHQVDALQEILAVVSGSPSAPEDDGVPDGRAGGRECSGVAVPAAPTPDGGASGAVVPAETELAFVLAAVALSGRSGAPLSAALRTAAEVSRAEQAARERQTVLMAGPKASMLLLTLLPLAGPFLAWSLGWDPLAQSATIYLLMAGGGLLTLGGWLWSRRLIRAAGRITAIEPDPARSLDAATVLDLARAVDLMPLALLTGCGATEAIELVAGVVPGRVAADLKVAVAARRWDTEPGREWQLAGPAWAAVGIAWRTADRAGAAPAGLLGATAERIRRTEATRIEARIQRAGVLLVLPLGLCFLPGFLLTTVVPVVADLVIRIL